jgi:hypothetical protein
MEGMTVTIMIIVALLFLVIVILGIRSVYLITNQPTTMLSDTKTKALDVFMYVGIAISLIVSITNVIQILFLAIERRFVDVLSATQYYVDSSQSDARFAIASLVVMFPIYIGLSWYTSRNIAKFLYKQDIPVRKILIYCTLFVTVLTLIGTLVSVIYTYLGGELSVRFAYKAGTVFLMALSLFAYYYYSLRRDYSKKTRVPGFMALVASLVVALSVVWSISVSGSPATMRAKKIDSVRLSDISRLQQEILNRVNMTEKLPGDLSELNNAFQGYAVPSDPITKVAYGYKVIQQPTLKMNYITSKKELVSPAIFEICATFEIVRNVNERGQSVASVPIKISIDSIDPTYSAMNTYYEGDQSSFWNHGVGETCFKRIISSEMYYGK